MNSDRTFYLIRHGATALNRESGGADRIRGMRDVSLSKEGWHEVEQLATRLANSQIKTLVSSPLHRAEDTARAIQDQCATVRFMLTDNCFCPWDVGEFTGQESAKVTPELLFYASKKPFRKVPGGESFNEFKERVFRGLYRYLRLNSGDLLAVVTHHRVERLIKSWMAANQPKDMSVDMDVMFQFGETPAHAEKIMLNMLALRGVVNMISMRDAV